MMKLPLVFLILPLRVLLLRVAEGLVLLLVLITPTAVSSTSERSPIFLPCLRKWSIVGLQQSPVSQRSVHFGECEEK